jgi:hypothetical protein
MSDLDGLYLRLFRNGRWRSLSITKAKYLTNDEISSLSWKDELLRILRSDPDWQQVSYGWMKEIRSEK